MACCGQQSSKTFKIGSDARFTCLGCSQEHVLEMGHNYPTASPLVAGEMPSDAWRPMTSPTETIVAFVGPCCAIDATDWTEDKPVHVYPHAVGILQRLCWPADEAGASLFTTAEIEQIAHAHSCCIHFDKELDCAAAPAWLSDQNAAGVPA